MASPARYTADPVALEQALRKQPEAFEFFEALRAIECAFPGKPRLGRSARPSDDPVRLRHTPSLSFAPRSIDRYEPGGDNRPGRLYGLFLGLFGPNAPLPLHFTEYAMDRKLNAKDGAFVAFADIFHHRMLSLFYRAWADAQPTVQFDRPDEDRFRLYVGALIGLATPHLEERDALPDHAKRFFAGRLLQLARNAEGLRGLLERFFSVPVQVVEFVAEWMPLPRDAYCRLGADREVAELGRTAVLGAQVRGCQQRFRLRLGPLDRATFQRLLPGGETLRQLAATVRTFVGDEKSWDLQLVLKADEVPVVRLGQAGRMGLDSWLGQRAWSIADADDVVLRPSG
ncbi:type VI secretion system protein ImpH [Luteibacter rhizovicinus]|uniref:Type VI secretion system protein ImpH n=1 Tax=Luteibacter rhizovicinus TaxID=242606 RepID=A0A4R3YTL7_9GAMM|nr:type VI secretion system baseplate subunit TssG [Luteibacter rhizovicinus]TCV95850.1 type VI secretion system protein ImpH [Luteibacter rhizovicinus]